FADRRPISYMGIEQTDDGVPLTADVIDVAPDPRTTPVSGLRIVFTKSVTGFDMADLRLTRAGNATNLLTAQQTLTSPDGVTWTLGNLSSITAPDGLYTLSLAAGGSGITDSVGSQLAFDAW